MTADHHRLRPVRWPAPTERAAATVPRHHRPLSPAGSPLFLVPPGDETARGAEPVRPATVPAVAFSDPDASLLR
ncbi:hypothetical protein [Kitasatospora sp. NPDC051914]|uniref:hypothetical protein n=1 Tax=Kitasatospora sp. NPDC051914 TaxID=3154945 RepID=UPI00341807F1